MSELEAWAGGERNCLFVCFSRGACLEGGWLPLLLNHYLVVVRNAWWDLWV